MRTRRHPYPVRFRGQRGPNGRPLCVWCGQEVPPHRRSWCSEKCVDDYSIRANPGYARRKVAKRDGGVCAACGLDTGAFLAHTSQLRAVWPDLPDRYLYLEPDREVRRTLEALFGINFSQSLWEMDHIVEVVNGGGACGLENLQTLCVWCHKRKTARLAGELTARRKALRGKK